MWTKEVAPIFDQDDKGKIMPNENWNKLLNNARETAYKSCQVLGYYVAGVAVEYGDFCDLEDVQDACIAAAEPPMTPTERRQFRTAFGRMGVLEDAFVMTANQVEDAREGVTV
jgi:hypothetical protein